MEVEDDEVPGKQMDSCPAGASESLPNRDYRVIAVGERNRVVPVDDPDAAARWGPKPLHAPAILGEHVFPSDGKEAHQTMFGAFPVQVKVQDVCLKFHVHRIIRATWSGCATLAAAGLLQPMSCF